MACSLKEGASRAKERNRDGHGLQSGTEGVLGVSRASERERDWQHGLQSGTEGSLGASQQSLASRSNASAFLRARRCIGGTSAFAVKGFP